MIITNEILTASQFAEYYSGEYPLRCDTFDEVRDYLGRGYGIYIKRGLTFTEIDKLDPDKKYVIVEFSLEENYTEHEYLIMFMQKRYEKRFMKNFKADYPNA